MRAWWLVLPLLALGFAHAQDSAVVLGKQRAAALPLEWEVRDAGHPALGPIRFGVLKTPVVTPAGNARVYSRAYVSCQKGIGKLAIELTNTPTADDAGGLRPAKMPRLVCNRPEAGRPELVREDLFANWEVNEIGDAMTRGFRPFPLRECATISVEQEVQLPAGSTPATVPVKFDISPYSRELDSVFVACGETSAYGGQAPPRKVAEAPKAAAPAPRVAQTPPAAAAPPPPRPPAPAPADAGGWRNARVVPDGKTNVRAAPNLQGAIVTTLHPGSVLLAQPAGPEWWRVRPTKGAAFEGYVRGDRLVVK